MNNSIIHIALRYNPNGDVNLLNFKPDLKLDTITHHQKIEEENGYVWWGKFGREGFSSEKLEILKKQIDQNIPTFVYLLEPTRAFKASILDVKEDINEIDIINIPQYYREKASEICELFLKLNSFKELDRMETIISLRKAADPDEVGGFHKALKGQSSRFYVVESDTTLDKLFQKESENKKPKTRTQLIETLVTDPVLREWIKKLYDNVCQFCNTQIKVPEGFHSEAAHIKAKSHGGNDDKANILCLCPNCHSKFDLGGFYVIKEDDSFNVYDYENSFVSKLNLNKSHPIDENNFKDHIKNTVGKINGETKWTE